LDEFWAKAMSVFPLPNDIQPLGEDFLPPSKYSAVLLKDSDVGPVIGSNRPKSITVFHASVKQNRRVTSADHFQDVRLISFDLTGSSLTYAPGDVAMIQPQNSDENVDLFFQIFANQLDRNQIVSLEPNWSETKLPPEWILPSRFKLEECARRWWDLSCTPRRTFFQLLARFSSDEMEREKLLELSSSEGQQDLYNYCNRPRRTLVEVLFDFSKSARQVPMAYLFDLIPAIKPRAFSIASSLKVHSDNVF
jgi:sulfite reductase alpha subunit-like flavoprotein